MEDDGKESIFEAAASVATFLSTTNLRMMYVLNQEDGIQVSYFCRHLKSTILREIKGDIRLMEKYGLVEQSGDSVRLTPEGKEFYRDLIKPILDKVEKRFPKFLETRKVSRAYEEKPLVRSEPGYDLQNIARVYELDDDESALVSYVLESSQADKVDDGLAKEKLNWGDKKLQYVESSLFDKSVFKRSGDGTRFFYCMNPVVKNF